jgi:hypothetical protein
MPNIHPLGEPFSPELVAHFPALEDWRIATNWCMVHGIPWSCHLSNNFFDTAAFDEAHPVLANFEFLPFNPRAVVHSTAYDIMKPRGGPAERAVLHHVEELTEAAWDRLAAMTPATPPPEAHGIPASPSEGAHWVRTAADHALTMPGAPPSVPGFIQRPTRDLEAQQEAATARATYRLLLSRKNPDNNKVSLATLSGPFVAFLNTIGQDTAIRAFQRSIRGTLATIGTAPSGSGWEVFNNLTPEMFTRSLVAAIHRAQLSPYPFYQGGLITYKHHITALAFASPTSEVDSRNAHDSSIAHSAAVGNDIKTTSYHTEIFSGGRLHGPDDVAKLLANLMTFLLHLSPDDARHSALFIQLQALQLELTEPHNKRCLDQLKGPGAKPRAAHAFVEAIQSVFAEYAAFATNDLALQAVLDIQNAATSFFVDPNIDGIHHQMLETKVLSTLADLRNDIRRGTLGLNGILYGLLHPESNPGSPSNKGKGGLKQPPTTQAEGPPSKKQAAATPSPACSASGPRTPTPAQLQNREEGFLRCLSPKKAGEISRLSGTFPFPVGGRERFCFRFCLRDWFCGFATCRHGHPASFSALSREDQQSISAWVEKNKSAGIVFVEGMGPSSTS